MTRHAEERVERLAMEANGLYDDAMAAKRIGAMDTHDCLMIELDRVYADIRHEHEVICRRQQARGQSNNQRGTTTPRVNRRKQHIVTLLETHGRLATRDIVHATDYGRHAVYTALQKLVADGVVESDGFRTWWLKDAS